MPLEQDIEDVGGKVFTNIMYDMPPEIQRPVIYSTVEWTSDKVTGDVLFQETFPSRIFDLVQNMRFRLANRSLFSCDISLKVYLQSVPTQCGALVLTMSPMSRAPENQFSALSGPHVILNAGEHVSGEIVIPYIRDTRNMVVRSYGTGSDVSYFDFVRAQLMVLSPLRVTDGTSVKLVVCAQLLNPVYTGSGYVEIPIAVNQGKEEKKKKGESSSGKPVQTTIKPVPDRGDTGKKEKEKMTKPETYAKAAANTLVSIASCAVTVAKIVGTGMEIASAMGLSKPVVEHKITPFGSSKDLFGPNVDGQFFGHQMGSFFDAKTIPHPLTFGREDPMAISNIAKRSGLVGSFTWDTSTVAGTQLCVIPLTPGVCTYKSESAVYHTPLSLLAHIFRRWRGKLNFRLRLFATKFHAGQLEIIANYGSTSMIIDTEDQAACCHRCVMDISNNNEVEIECGFYYNSPVEECVAAEFNNTNEPFPDLLHIRCLSTLTASGDVSSTIEGIIEIWSDDIQFGLPGLSMVAPEEVPVAFNQGVFEDSLLHSIEDGRVVLSDPWEVPLKVWDRFASGERIENLREVTRRMMFIRGGMNLNGMTPHQVVQGLPWYYAASNFFVFQVGGWRLGLYPYNQNYRVISYRDETIGAGEPVLQKAHAYAEVVMYTEAPPFEPIFLNLPNNYKYGVLVLNQQIDDTKSFIIDTQEDMNFLVCASLADDASWGGLNYIEYDRVGKFVRQTPADLDEVW